MEYFEQRGGLLTEEELVDEQGRQSFPGSDPPASWAGPDERATSSLEEEQGA